MDKAVKALHHVLTAEEMRGSHAMIRRLHLGESFADPLLQYANRLYAGVAQHTRQELAWQQKRRSYALPDPANVAPYRFTLPSIYHDYLVDLAGVARKALREQTNQHLETAETWGVSVNETAKGLADILKGFITSRLKTIVRTEGTRVAAAARADIAENAGQWGPDYWIYSTILDGRQTRTCDFANGHKQPLARLFETAAPNHYNAIAHDSPITTHRGVIPVQEVQVGDLVLTHRHRWRSVYGRMARQHTDILVLQTDDGKILRVSHEHPVLTATGWQIAGDLQLGDKLLGYTEQLAGGADDVVADAENNPAFLGDGFVPFFVADASIRVAVAFPVEFNRYFVVWESEVKYVAKNGMLGDHTNPTASEQPVEIHLNWGELSSTALRTLVSHLCPHILPAGGVVAQHLFGMPNSPAIAFLSATPSPMVWPSHNALSGGSAYLSYLISNWDLVFNTPPRQQTVAQLQLALEFAQRSAVLPMLTLDEVCDDLGLRQVYASFSGVSRTKRGLASGHSNLMLGAKLAQDGWAASQPFSGLTAPSSFSQRGFNGGPDNRDISVPSFTRHTSTLIATAVQSNSMPVYDLCILEDESYVTNGIVVHNCRAIESFGYKEDPEDEAHPDWTSEIYGQWLAIQREEFPDWRRHPLPRAAQ